MTRRRIVWLSVLVAIAALAALGVAGAAMLPEVVRRAAVWRLESLTQRRVTIDRVDLDLLGGQVAVHGLQIDDRDEPAPLARADRITGRDYDWTLPMEETEAALLELVAVDGQGAMGSWISEPFAIV